MNTDLIIILFVITFLWQVKMSLEISKTKKLIANMFESFIKGMLVGIEKDLKKEKEKKND